jgi:hypothetical protein
MPVFMKMDGIDGDIGRGSSAGGLFPWFHAARL